MSRNIDQRVEVGCPIYHPEVKQSIIDIINIQLNDNTKARIIDTEQSNQYQISQCDVKQQIPKIRAQISIYDYLKNKQLAKITNIISVEKKVAECHD